MEFHPDTPSAEALRAALGRLTPEAQPAWGKLDAAGMVAHVNKFMELYLGAVRMGGLTALLARSVGKVFLKRVGRTSPVETPRNLATAPVLRVASGADFEGEVARFAELLGQMESLSGPYKHPVYGMMDADDAKGLVRHHTAHHFHQFGLI